MKYKKLKSQGGYIALISVMIISAITLVIAIDANLFGISESDMGLQQSQSSKAFYLTTLCAEDALMKLKNNLSYPGGETLTVGEGTCTIFPLEGSGNVNRVIKTSGTAYNQTRKMKIEIIQVNPEMQINSWKEVINF